MAQNTEDNFQWAIRLGCPPSALTDSVKKSLNSGLIGLMWDQLASGLRPVDEVSEARKNILLYRLKHDEENPSIQNVRTTQHIRAARNKLVTQIQSLEDQCEKKDFDIRLKQQELSKVKARRESTKAKTDLMQFKFNDTQTQAEDCRVMRLVCQKLMPPTCTEIVPDVVDECLSLVSAISTKAEKKIAWNRVAETLGTIDISTLWNTLLFRRIADTKELMSLGISEIQDDVNSSGEHIDFGIARVCGETVTTAAQGQVHRVKVDRREELVMEYIEKIEASETNAVDVTEWLSLTLEVGKLETEQSRLQSEISILEKSLESQFDLDEQLRNLELDVCNVDAKVEKWVQDIRRSLALLRNAGLHIAIAKNKISSVLEDIVSLKSANRTVDYHLHVDLTTELNIFYASVEPEALRKILLKHGVGAYRHAECCISKAQRSITATSQRNFSSRFPMIRAPIYELLNCYSNFLVASKLARHGDPTKTKRPTYNEDLLANPSTLDCSSEAIDLLNATDSTCDKVRQQLLQFDTIFDAWCNQTMQKVMEVDDRIVNGATFKEWSKRYSTLLYMLQRSK